MSIIIERPAAAQTRCRIMETAEKLFRTIGYQKTTVADIAKALRMSPANVYRFFESKKAINEAVAEHLMSQAEAAISEIADRDMPAAARLSAMITTLHRLNEGLYTQDHRMHEMVEVALTESWAVVQGHIERKSAIFHEFKGREPLLACRCGQAAAMRFFHPTLLVQCKHEVGPTVEEMIAFILRGLGCETAQKGTT